MLLTKTELRLRMLPIAQIHEALPKSGLVYEVGSGYGVLGAKLTQLSSRRKIIAIDLDTEKISEAKRTYSLGNLSFKKANAINFPYKSCEGAILSDFLHHLPYSAQELLLARLAKKVKRRGVVVIKEIDKNDILRASMSRIWDYIFYPQDKIYYRSKQELVKIMEGLGFEVQTHTAVAWFPGSTRLFICRKI